MHFVGKSLNTDCRAFQEQQSTLYSVDIFHITYLCIYILYVYVYIYISRIFYDKYMLLPLPLVCAA